MTEGGAIESGVWRYARASRAHVVIDAEEYFARAFEAMLAAEHRIMLIGWDFDTRVEIGPNDGSRRKRGDPPRRLGAFFPWLTRRKPGLEIRVLKWNFGALKMFLRGSMPFDLLRWWMAPGIDFKFDSAHPFGCSHHQKIVVIDDTFAVCGGIDMTGDRWDTRDHVEDDPRRRRPNGQRYDPWHDATMAMEGEAAAALGAYGRTRWVQAGGKPMDPCPPREGSPWPEAIAAEFHDIDIGMARTRSEYEDIPETREIVELFCAQIARARRFIYAESQYFASRRIAEAMTMRLAEPDPPEIVVVNPESADGWLEQQAMDTARIRLLHSIGDRDHAKRFSLWCPYTTGGTPIYVHAKLMIIDDEVLRVGSANMNNRSMGLDSEFDVFIDAQRSGGDAAREAIRGLRISLLAEHTGQDVATTAAQLEACAGSMAAMLDAAPKGAKCLRRYEVRPLTEAEQAMADNEALDPEHPEEMLSFYKRGGLFRSRILRRPA